MLIPILQVLDRQNELTDWAQTKKPPPDLSVIKGIAKGVVLDASYFAIPLANNLLETRDVRDPFNPKVSEKFAVRGVIDVDIPSIDHLREGDLGENVFVDLPVTLFVESSINSIDDGRTIGTTDDVKTKLCVDKLRDQRLDGEGVAIAIMDTGIDLDHLRSRLRTAVKFCSVTFPGAPVTPGAVLLPASDHGTMCAYDALIAAPHATLIDIPMLTLPPAPMNPMNPNTGVREVRTQISQALVGFSALREIWTKIRNGSLPFKALVANNSWGVVAPNDDVPERFTNKRFVNNPAHMLNVHIARLARDGVDIVFAAGNCGEDAPSADCGCVVVGGDPAGQRIMGANALPEVLTVAACDTAGHRLVYSSQGPVIEGMPTKWSKPDVSAYAHFKGSGAWQNSDPDPGTSAACAVASGCVAALRSKFPSATTSPAEMIAAIRRSARAEHGTSTSDYGMGIIDVLAAEADLDS